MKIALDSNVLLYAAGVVKVESDHAKTSFIRPLIEEIALKETIVCPLQTFGEAYHVMLRFGRSREECRNTLQKWGARFETVASSEHAFLSAIDLATDHKLQFWDALIINAAADAGCQLLLSEDLQPGFVWYGLRVANPFAPELDRRLAEMLAG